MTLVLTVAIIVSIAASTVLWLGLNVPHLVVFTASMIEWCRDLFLSCLPYVSLFKALLMWAGVAALGGGFVYALARGLSGLLRGRAALRRLPLSDRGLSVVLIRDDSVKTAFTCGLLRPRIYLSTGLLGSLSRDEVRSVLLHEMEHRRRMDPLRSFFATFLRDAFFYLPIGSFLARAHHVARERDADDAVVARTGDPLGLAETLLKVASFGTGTGLASAGAAVSIRGAGNLEKRIRRLVEGGEARERPGVRVVLTSLALAAVLLVGLSLPLSASPYDPGSCDMDHCSTHMEDSGRLEGSGKSCRTHCAVMD